MYIYYLYCRWNKNRQIQTTFSPRAADNWQRRRRQQLRQGPLHHWQGTHRLSPGAHQQARRAVSGTAGVHRVPQFRRRHRVGFHVPAHGTPDGGLREEVQARVLRVPGAGDVHVGRRAVQLRPDDAQYSRALWLRLSRWQRSHLRNMPG